MQNNKLGVISSFSIETSYRDLIRGSIDFVTDDYGALNEFMQELRGEVGKMPTFKKEYMCLYCGSPNNIEHTHCKKCGAPRSFLIG